MEVVRINKMYLIDHSENKLKNVFSHPYYLSLKTKNKHIFENYIKYSTYQSNKYSGKWENFVEIYKNIKKKRV